MKQQTNSRNNVPVEDGTKDMISNEYTLSQSFCDSIKEELIDIVGELSEVGLDTITEDEGLKSIPFISTAISLYKIGTTIREKHHLKKLVAFIMEINKNIDNDKREKYIKKFNENKKFRKKELEYIIIILDRYLNHDKSKWLAKLYIAYLSNNLTWIEFLQYSEIINNFLPGDEIFLKYDRVPKDSRYSYNVYVERFCAMGLLEKYYINEPVPNISGAPIPVKIQKGVKYSLLGKILCNIIFE